ncbi:MAG: hypothetical protein MZU91_08440 [Desulfosudis oleivorans]|nr:hypothetical protein [Desulfosudis oleivorans]
MEPTISSTASRSPSTAALASRMNRMPRKPPTAEMIRSVCVTGLSSIPNQARMPAGNRCHIWASSSACNGRDAGIGSGPVPDFGARILAGASTRASTAPPRGGPIARIGGVTTLQRSGMRPGGAALRSITLR